MGKKQPPQLLVGNPRAAAKLGRRTQFMARLVAFAHMLAPEHLLQGHALEHALRWQQRQGENVSAAEREFLAASQEAARRRAQRWFVVAGVLAAIVGPLTYLYVRAENQRESARLEPYRKLKEMFVKMETIRADSETSLRVPEMEPKARRDALALCRGGDSELPGRGSGQVGAASPDRATRRCGRRGTDPRPGAQDRARTGVEG